MRPAAVAVLQLQSVVVKLSFFLKEMCGNQNKVEN